MRGLPDASLRSGIRVNHFISGIIKITLIEASIALLLIDAAAGERFAKVRGRAAAFLAGLMVFAWANYGVLRFGVSLPYVLTGIPMVLLCAWLVHAGAGPEGALTERMKSFRKWAAGVVKAKYGAPAVGAVLAGALALAWVGWGVSTKSAVMVHHWEQFHFYVGAKYQREIGWFNLYKAAILADRETVNALTGLPKTRDLTNFEEVPVDTALADAQAVRARFSDAQWEAFKADWTAMVRQWGINWNGVMNDHGNSNSPAWSVIAHPITKLVPISPAGTAWLGWLDMLLMLTLWLFAWQTFGHRVAAMGLFVWAMEPIVFDYLSGSFLRWDWLFAIGMATCFIKRGKWDAAGAFFGYAAATKLFPIFFGVALGIRAALEWRQTRVFRKEYLKFLRGAVIAGGVFVALAALMFGPSAWVEYAQRIQVAQVEKFYSIQYSLKTVFLQLAASPGDVIAQTIFPSSLAQALPQVDIKDYAAGFLIARLIFTALIVVLIRRADDVEAFVLGPLLVFTWLTVNMYYWNMLGLLAMGLMLRKERSRPALGMLIGLHVIFMVFYLYQHLNRGFSEGFAVAYLLCVLIIGTAVWEWRDSQATAPAPAPAPNPKGKPARG